MIKDLEQEPEFLVDDVLEEQQKELEKNKAELEIILQQLKHPKLYNNALFLKSFVRGMILNFKKEKPKPKLLPKKQLQRFLPKKQPRLSTPKQIQRPLPKQIQKPLPVKHQTITPIKKLTAKIKEITKLKKDLIIDKFTNNVLATANIDSKYSVQEPILDENDKIALEKIIRKRPKSIKKAWKFILKFGKKFKIKEDHKENLKYYVINRFFALGKLEPLLHDKDITDITCNGIVKPIVVTHKGKEIPTNLSFKDANELTTFLNLLTERTKQKLDKKHPVLDTTYRDYRIHVIFGVEPGNSKFTFTKV